MMVDSGVDDRRENASWLTTWFDTAGLTSIVGKGSSEAEVGDERGESIGGVVDFGGELGVGVEEASRGVSV